MIQDYDRIMEVLAAWRAHNRLEYKPGSNSPFTMISTTLPALLRLLADGIPVRVKPEAVTVPWTRATVPDGCYIRLITKKVNPTEWLVVAKDDEFVRISSEVISYERLMQSWEYRLCSLSSWNPCSTLKQD